MVDWPVVNIDRRAQLVARGERWNRKDPEVASRQGSSAGFLSEKHSPSSRREYPAFEWYRMARTLSSSPSLLFLSISLFASFSVSIT